MTDMLNSISVLLQLIGLIAAGIWAVSAIRSTTDRLTTTIANLEVTVKKIGDAIDAIEKKAYDHELRISMLERKDK